MKKYIVVFIAFLFTFIGKIDAYLSFKVGEEIKYKGISYYVIKNSDDSESAVTLLKADPLIYSDIQLYSEGTGAQVDGLGGVQFGLTSDYKTSYVKHIVDAWAMSKLNENDLVADSTGYSVRLLSNDDLTDNLGYEKKNEGTLYPSSGGNTPRFVVDIRTMYWTMTQYSDSLQYVWYIGGDGTFTNRNVNNDCIFVRPVITIKKEAIDSYDKVIEYNNNKYYIINDDINNNRITLLKANPITSDEIKDYLSSTEIASKVDTFYSYAQMSYYSRDNCVSAGDTSGCSNDYQVSDVKQVVDIWAKNFTKQEDLIEARLLNRDDLFLYLGYDQNITSADEGIYTKANENVPTWVYNKRYHYWTMVQGSDSNKVWYVDKEGVLFHDVTSSYSVRPVITLKRSAIYGSENNNQENKSNRDSVKVPNTFRKKTLIIMFIGFIIVLVGVITYYSVKERK